jgi:hypothetical protein
MITDLRSLIQKANSNDSENFNKNSDNLNNNKNSFNEELKNANSSTE